MNSDKSVSNYQWELVGINNETNERIAFPCSPNSVGAIVNQIVNEDAEGLWEIPEWVKENLKDLIGDGVITLELVSKLAKAEKEKFGLFLNDPAHELKLASDSVFMLMELTKNLSSDRI